MLRFSAAIVIILLLAGCAGMTKLPTTQTGENNQPVEFSLLTDIPIPPGASMDNERSLVLSDRDRWTGRVVMKTWKPAIDATTFYQQQMPAFGWAPVMSVTSEVSVLNYTRGDRAATVQIEKSNVWGSTVLVTVAPRQSHATSGYGAASTYAPVQSQPLR